MKRSRSRKEEIDDDGEAIRKPAQTDRQDRQGNVSFFALTHARD
jgi:hypothetical protein